MELSDGALFLKCPEVSFEGIGDRVIISKDL